MLCAMLSGRRARLSRGAPTATAALRLIDEVSPDVVILDVGLPGMDGLEVARRIRANPRHSGHPPDRAHRLRSGRATARQPHRPALIDHLVKPVQPAELVKVIAEVTTSSASGHKLLGS